VLNPGAIIAVALAAVVGLADEEAAALPTLPPVLPQVEVWTSQEVYRRGERAEVWFETTEDAYVTIVRIDTDGRLRVLFPRQPWHDNFVPGGRTTEIWSANQPDGHAFLVDDDPGQGYIFAIATSTPFEYGTFASGDHWDYRNIGYYGRITGDPYVALGNLIDHIVPAAASQDYTYDVYPYYVDERYQYPRFLCYDCHSYVGFRYWDPYDHSCVRFRMVIYDDPFYYPIHAYPATRVVYTGPRQPVRRYVFQDWTPEAEYVTTLRQRPADPSSGRRAVSSGATARDVGGVGRVPAPVIRSVPDPQSRARRAGMAPREIPNAGSGRIQVTPPAQKSDSTDNKARPKLERREPAPRDTLSRPQPTARPGSPARRSPAARDTSPARVVPSVPKPTAVPASTSGVKRPDPRKPAAPPAVKKPATPRRKPESQVPRRPERPSG